MQLSQAAINPKIPIKPNKRMIVLIAFIGGFIISILFGFSYECIKT